jgi:Na+-translocating ferredoxin:NAD+ oxidoreductase subunit B
VHGVEGPPRVAVIDEAVCIGCAKCLPVCPTDAIVGARRQLHTVIAAECTGCELCIPPCPVDCITMADVAPAPLPLPAIRERAVGFRARYVGTSRASSDVLTSGPRHSPRVVPQPARGAPRRTGRADAGDGA